MYDLGSTNFLGIFFLDGTMLKFCPDVAANFLITQKTDIHRTFQKSVQSKGSVVSDKIKKINIKRPLLYTCTTQ